MHVTLLRGSDAALYAFWSAERPSPALLLAPRPGDLRSWASTRALFQQVFGHLPADHAATILEPRRAAASLLLHQLEATLSTAERRQRSALELQQTSHLTHNFVLQTPLFEALADLVGELLTACSKPLLVPNAALLTWEDGALLKLVCRRFPNAVPKLRIGYDSSFTPPPDSDGIIWACPLPKVVEVVENLRAFHPGSTVDLDPSGAPENGSTEPAAWDVLVGRMAPELSPDELSPFAQPAQSEDPEGHAFARLANPEPLTPGVAREIAETILRVFRRAGFATSMRLATQLLKRQPDLSDRSLAQVHATLALAAHNRQFSSKYGPQLAEFILRHLEAALALEDRPEPRAALLYRTAVTLGRRLKRFEEALSRSDEGLVATHHLEPAAAVYQEAWVRNIRAYLLLRTDRRAEASEDSHRAYAQLDALLATSPSLHEASACDRQWQLDLRATHSLLAHNAYAAARFAGAPPERLGELLSRTLRGAREIPALALYDAMSWIQYEVRLQRLSTALERALAAAHAARRIANARLDLTYTVRAAELADSLGKAEQAAELFAQTIHLHGRLALETPLVFRVRHALAMLRSGRIQDAAALFAKISPSPSSQHPNDSEHAQLLAYRSLAAAHLGDGALVDRLGDAAIDAAIECGARATMARVAVLLGTSCTLLGRPADAAEAFARTMDLAGSASTSPTDTGTDQLTEDFLIALLGIQEVTGTEPTRTVAALRLFPHALHHSGCWWELRRLLDCLSQVAHFAPATLQTRELAEPLEAVLAAADQRDDCVEARRRFLAVWQD